MHNVSSAGEALHYFSQDNYYTERQGLEESEWFGKGAAALGLEGKIEKEPFFDALNGRYEGQELGRIVKNEKTGESELDHRPGTDITFSAPKSVSLLSEVQGSQEVRQAHEEAVKAALGYIERELSYTRQMENGELKSVQTGNLTVAMFRHNTSRDLDPQTHTHAIIMNATKREDGQWRSLTNDEIYKAQKVVGAIYTGELADQLQKLGYELQRTDERGNFEVVGVTREQIEHFSQRRAGMEAAMKERGLDISTATAEQKETAALATRAKKKDVDHGELIADWKDRAKAVGLDLGVIEARAAATRESGGVMRQDWMTGKNAMEYAAAHLIEREAVVSKGDIMKTALEHGAGRVSPLEVEKAFARLEAEGSLVKLPDGNYTTQKMLNSERWSMEQVQTQKWHGDRIIGPNTVAERIGELERRQGFGYTVGQKEAITTVLASHDRFVGVEGLAGTGKTTMLRAVKDLAEEYGFTVRGMAPTGAAAKVLGQETGMNTETVAMFSIKERRLQKEISAAQQRGEPFKRNRELWVVDESSFLSQRQKAQIDHMAIKAGAKVAYLGDTLQLQGVEAGKPFELAQRAGMETAQMTEISRQKNPELKAIVDVLTGRDQLKPGERLTNVQLNNNWKAFAAYDKAGRVVELELEKVIPGLVKEVVEMGAAERARTMVITAYNEDRHAINDGVRAGLKEKGELGTQEQQKRVYESKGWTRAQIKESQYYRAGDVIRFGRDYKALQAQKGEYASVASVEGKRGVVVLQKADGTRVEWEPRKNNNVEVYDAKVRAVSAGELIRFTRNGGEFKNGEVAKVVRIDGDKAAITLRGDASGATKEVDLSQNRHWDHAYASTVHGSQGSTEYRTLFHIRAPEGGDEHQQARELQAMAKVFGDRSFYVGSTRASEEIRVYTNNKTSAARAVMGHQDKTSGVETIEKATRNEKRPSIDAIPRDEGATVVR